MYPGIFEFNMRQVGWLLLIPMGEIIRVLYSSRGCPSSVLGNIESTGVPNNRVAGDKWDKRCSHRLHQRTQKQSVGYV